MNIVIYTVRFKPDDSDEYKYVATLPPSHGRICAPLTVEDGLEPLTTFTFQVRAESAVPYSAPDSGWSAGIQKYIGMLLYLQVAALAPLALLLVLEARCGSIILCCGVVHHCSYTAHI